MLFKRKPHVIEAYQWFPGMLDAPGVRHVKANRVDLSQTRGILVDRPARHVVDTLYGEAAVVAGDWIITGLDGVRYPCKADHFHMLYEPLS